MMTTHKKNLLQRNQIVLFILFCILFYFSVFHKLGSLPIGLWDESLFTFRALYMELHGSYMYNFNLFDGMPNHMNTKLPFTTFFQVVSLKLFGLNELAVRLPSVLIFTSTAFYMFHHFKVRFDSIVPAYIFGLIAISSTGFVGAHMLRTGNQDAPFACYLLLAAIAFLKYIERHEAKPLSVFVVFMLAALLTKNLLAGLLVPGVLLFVLCTRQLMNILKDYKFWLACLTIIGVYCSTIFYYETYNPGFINRMWNYELMGRFTQEMEQHGKPPFYYFITLAIEKFIPYFFILPIVFACAFNANVTQKEKRSILYFSSISLCYLTILSFSKTQTIWYIAPIYLLGAYILAVGSLLLTRYLKKQTKRYNLTLISGLFSGWVLVYSIVLSNMLHAQPRQKDEKYGWFMESIAKQKPLLKSYTLVDFNFGTSAGFYKEMYNRKNQGYDIRFQRNSVFSNDQIIMTCLNNVLEPTTRKYHFEVLSEWEECKLIKIISRKQKK